MSFEKPNDLGDILLPEERFCDCRSIFALETKQFLQKPQPSYMLEGEKRETLKHLLGYVSEILSGKTFLFKLLGRYQCRLENQMIWVTF